MAVKLVIKKLFNITATMKNYTTLYAYKSITDCSLSACTYSYACVVICKYSNVNSNAMSKLSTLQKHLSSIHFIILSSIYVMSVLTYKTLNTSVPQYLSQRINRRVNALTLRSTATPLLIQPFARTDFAKRSFRCAVPSAWNSLPTSVIGSDSLSVFKSRLKHSYFIGPLTSTHNRLPPVPLKLRPHGALQICLLLLFFLDQYSIKMLATVTQLSFICRL